MLKTRTEYHIISTTLPRQLFRKSQYQGPDLQSHFQRSSLNPRIPQIRLRLVADFLNIYEVTGNTTVLSVVRQLIRPRRRGKDNIKMDLQEMGFGGMD